MGSTSGTTRVVELRAGDTDDPDASRAAAVLAAYFEAEEARNSRRLLWRLLAIVGLIVWVLEASTPFVPRATLLVIVVVLAGVAVSAALEQWRAEHNLRASLGEIR
jgi:hypothetical protein